MIDDALAIRAAARDAAASAAILTRDRVITFGELAGLLRDHDADGERPHRGEHAADDDHPQRDTSRRAVLAHPSVATLLAIYAALEQRRPLALLHPRLAAPALDRQRAAFAGARLPPDTAFVLFTSGSTGEPRGVVLSRAAVVAAAAAHAGSLGWQADDRWLACLPLAHAGGLAIAMRCLVARRALVLHEGDFDADVVGRLAVARRCTLASLVPAQLGPLAEPLRAAPLRGVLLGGAAAAPAQVAAAHHLPLLATYGLTETFGQIATARAPGGPLRALPGVALAAGTAAAPARIRVRAATLATCYLDGAPIAPELETADLGYLDASGALHVCGRADDVIISGGENVHPQEIEAVLAATAGVHAACAVGVPDARWGQTVAAALVTDPAFDREAALAAWRGALPPHAIPRRVAYVDHLPLLPTGKVDRRRVAELVCAREVTVPRR